MRPGTPELRTHDYRRHGTTSLVAALDVASGKVIGELHRRQRSIEFRSFLDHIEREVPTDLGVHLILDNSSTHKSPLIRRWLIRHPRFQVHFTPTYSSWINPGRALVRRSDLKNLTRTSPTSLVFVHELPVHHTKLVADSDGIRTVIPIESVHPFR